MVRRSRATASLRISAKVAKTQKVVGAVTHTTVTGLKNGRTYTFRVAAINAHGAGPARTSPAVKIGAALSRRTRCPPRRSRTRPSRRSRRPPWCRRRPRPLARPALPVPVPVPVPVPPIPSVCVGVPLTNGQATINASPAGTTFCLSGTHNWTLAPKSGDRLIGPAVLDGGNATPVRDRRGNLAPTSSSPTWRSATTPPRISRPRSASAPSRRRVGRCRTSTSTTTAPARVATAPPSAPAGRVLGGRFYNNRQGGIAGGGAHGATVDGAEIDHNNFTNDVYTTGTSAAAATRAE